VPDFKGTKSIALQPNDADVPYSFSFDVCSAEDANDGALPYGSTISDCEVKAFNRETAAEVTSEMVGTTGILANVVSVPLTWPATAGAGKYKLRFVVTLNTGATKEFDFNRVEAKDK
jgi:hypothetical protein